MKRPAQILGLMGLVGMMGAAAPDAALAAVPPGGVNGYTVGDYAFDFPAFDQNGSAVDLYQYSGTYIVLDYCAEWCPDCIALTPVLDQSTTALNATGVPEITLDLLLQNVMGAPSTVQTSQQWVRGLHISMPVLNLGGDGSSIAVGQLFNYGAIAGQPEGGFPTIVILSPTLKILSVNVGAPVSLDQMPAFVNQAIQADLMSDPSSALAEATVLTQRRMSASIPFALNAAAGNDILRLLGRAQHNASLARTDLACADIDALALAAAATTCSATSTKACPSGLKLLDPTFGAQLAALAGDVRTALECTAHGL
jgi:thiol-disulfide isomerase/thioredoxin